MCLLLGGCAGRGQESALDRIRARGELTWGADEQGGEPFVFEDAGRGGALVGFEVDLADTLARALGVRARFVQNDWTTLIPSLERGTFDYGIDTQQGRKVARVNAGGEIFSFTGDDDMWVFINRHLAINLGGLHPRKSASVSLDEKAPSLEISHGEIYPIHIFFAERHTVSSTFTLETSVADQGSCPQ